MRARLLAFFLPLALLCAAAPAAAQQASEHEVKAAFLFKFPAFVEWPQDAQARADAPFVIALLGADDIADELQKLAQDRSLQNRPLQVRRLKPGESPRGAHIVFVGAGEAGRLPQIAKALQNSPTLVVSDVPGGLEQGSAINFLLANNRVRFDIVTEAAERNRLRLSPRLLAVANSVRPRL